MHILGRILAFFLMLLVIPLFTIAACNAAFSATVANPQTYRAAFEDPRTLEDLVTLVLPALFTTVNDEAEFPPTDENLSQLSRIVTVLPVSVWRQISAEIVPSQWLQQTFEQSVNIFISLMDGDVQVLEQTLDLRAIRDALRGERAQEVASIIVSNAPPCRPEDLSALQQADPSARNLDFPICQPLDADNQNLAQSLIVAWLAQVAERIGTDEILVSDFVDSDDARALGLWVQFDERVMLLFYICPLGLVGLIIAFAVRSWRSFSRWVGITALLSGASIISLIFIIQLLLLNSTSELLSVSNDIERFVAQIATSLFRVSFLQASSVMLLHAGVAFSIGFILVVIAFWLPRRAIRQEAVIITADGQVFSSVTGQPLTPTPSKRP